MIIGPKIEGGKQTDGNKMPQRENRRGKTPFRE